MTFTPANPKKIKEPKNNIQYNKLIEKGNHFQKINEFEEALKYFTKAWLYKELNPNLYIDIARCLFKVGSRGKAIATLEMALAKSDISPALCFQATNFALEIKEYEMAVKFARFSAQSYPTDMNSIITLATALRENSQLDEAVEYIQNILPIYPENGKLWNVLAMSVYYRDGAEAAFIFAQEAYRLEPKEFLNVQTLTLIYTEMGDLENARKYVEELISIVPKDPLVMRNYSNICLAMGDLDAGMEALEWNNHPSDQNSVFFPYSITAWKGQDLTGKTILVGAEQGVGDQIIYAATIPALAKKAKKIILGCDPRLVPLFKNSFLNLDAEIEVKGNREYRNEDGKRINIYDGVTNENVDYLCLYTDVVRRTWDRLENVPDYSNGYLLPHKEDIEYWAEKLKSLPHKINIGFSWRSGLRSAFRDKEFPQILDLLGLFKGADVNLINVQYGECSEELKLLEDADLKIHNFKELDLKDDFNGTCAMMKNLDLVFGPTTAATHQAAAVGTHTCWLLMSKIQWLFGQESMPLFKSNKFFVKPYNMNWKDHLTQVKEDYFTPWLKDLKKT